MYQKWKMMPGAKHRLLGHQDRRRVTDPGRRTQDDEKDVSRQGEKIYEILISDDPEMELEKYYDFNSIQKFMVCADVISKASTFGEDKVDRKLLDSALLYASRFSIDAVEHKIEFSDNKQEAVYKYRPVLKYALTGAINLSEKNSETYDQLMVMRNNLNYMDYPKEKVLRRTR